VEEQALAAIEEAETEEVVPKEGEHGDYDDVGAEGQPVAADSSFGDEKLCAEGAVAVHVIDVGFECGVAVVNELAFEGADGAAALDGLVDGALAEADGGG